MSIVARGSRGSLLWAVVAVLPVAAAVAGTDPVRWEPVGEPGGGGQIVALAPSPRDGRRVLAGGDMLGVALSTDRGDHWSPAFGFVSYEMADLTWHPTDPNVVWTGALTGPYRSDDGGHTWTTSRQGMPGLHDGGYSQPIEKILFDPRDPHRLLAFGGSYRDWGNRGEQGAVWESRDAGASWTRLAKLTAQGQSPQLEGPGANITSALWAGGSATRIYAVADGGLMVSEDGGRSWERRGQGLPPAPKSRLAVHPTDANVAYIGVGNWKPEGAGEFQPGGVYRTTDAGRIWTRIGKGLAAKPHHDANLSSRYLALAISPKDPRVLWTCDGAYDAGLIYKSDDAGASWRAVAGKGDHGPDVARIDPACPAGVSLSGLVADPSNPDIAYGYGSEYIVRTVDGGKTWVDVTAERIDSTHWRGRGWNGWCATNVAFNPYRKGQVVLQGMDAMRGWISDDALRSFWYVSADPNPWCAGQDAAFTADGRFYLTTGQFGGTTGVIVGKDFGREIHVAYGSAHGLPEPSWGRTSAEGGGVYAHPSRGELVWAVLGGALYHSTDGGDVWKVIARRGFQFLAGDPAHPGRFYLTARDGVLATDDGLTFRNIGGPRPATRGRLVVDKLGRLLVCQYREGRAGLWRYTPSNQRWERLLDEPLARAVAVDPNDPNRLLLGTSQDPYNDHAGGNGLWISADAGGTWSPANQGLAMRRVNAVAFDPFDSESIVAGTYGMGFFRARWPRAYSIKGERSYTSTSDDTARAAPPDPRLQAAAHVIRDFGPARFDYLYGDTWKDEGITAGSEAGTGFVEIRATAAGGGGIVLNGAAIAPEGQTHLALRLMRLEGDHTERLNLNIMTGGKAHSVGFDLTGQAVGRYVTVLAALGEVPTDGVEQIQLAGTNFNPGAPPLRLRLDKLESVTPPAK